MEEKEVLKEIKGLIETYREYMSQDVPIIKGVKDLNKIINGAQEKKGKSYTFSILNEKNIDELINMVAISSELIAVKIKKMEENSEKQKAVIYEKMKAFIKERKEQMGEDIDKKTQDLEAIKEEKKAKLEEKRQEIEKEIKKRRDVYEEHKKIKGYKEKIEADFGKNHQLYYTAEKTSKELLQKNKELSKHISSLKKEFEAMEQHYENLETTATTQLEEATESLRQFNEQYGKIDFESEQGISDIESILEQEQVQIQEQGSKGEENPAPQGQRKGSKGEENPASQGQRQGSKGGQNSAPQGQRQGSEGGQNPAPQGREQGTKGGQNPAPQGQRQGTKGGQNPAPQGQEQDSKGGQNPAPQGQEQGSKGGQNPAPQGREQGSKGGQNPAPQGQEQGSDGGQNPIPEELNVIKNIFIGKEIIITYNNGYNTQIHKKLKSIKSCCDMTREEKSEKIAQITGGAKVHKEEILEIIDPLYIEALFIAQEDGKVSKEELRNIFGNYLGALAKNEDSILKTKKILTYDENGVKKVLGKKAYTRIEGAVKQSSNVANIKTKNKNAELSGIENIVIGKDIIIRDNEGTKKTIKLKEIKSSFNLDGEEKSQRIAQIMGIKQVFNEALLTCIDPLYLEALIVAQSAGVNKTQIRDNLKNYIDALSGDEDAMAMSQSMLTYDKKGLRKVYGREKYNTRIRTVEQSSDIAKVIEDKPKKASFITKIFGRRKGQLNEAFWKKLEEQEDLEEARKGQKQEDNIMDMYKASNDVVDRTNEVSMKYGKQMRNRDYQTIEEDRVSFPNDGNR